MTATRIGRPRRRIVVAIVVATLIILFFVLRALAGLYADSLWYSSIHQHEVFSTILTTKIGLFLVFGLVFFLAMWANLLLCNRLGPSELFLDAPEDELVRRFQGAVRPYSGRLYALLAFVLALIAAASTIGEWQSYLLFSHSKPFHVKDPQFHLDLSWYVFRLPFLSFVVDWILASLLAIIVFSVAFHYLNGGIRAARVTPRVSAGVKVHLSVLLALLAVAKAAGYLIARWHLVTSTTNGIFEGPGYTDVHARLPALMLLFWLCIIAAIILLFNIWQRGWTLPAIAVGLWAFVALAIGVIYPAVLQAAKVTPAQSQLEKPYIERNIVATRQAYSLTDVVVKHFSPTSTTPVLEQPGVSATLTDMRQWDPNSLIAQATFQQIQGIHNYYSISTLGEDRYLVDGKLTPVIEGVRELNTSGVTNGTWVNTHLQYTHGLGVVMIPSNENQTSTGQPVFSEGNVPPRSSGDFPALTVPGIYFGQSQNGFVVVDSNQKELNYEKGGANSYASYDPCAASPKPCQSGGAVPIGGFFRRLMFAIHFGDPNLLLSNLITSKSKIIYMRNVVQVAQHAAPFLSIDAHPYAAIINGHLDWILDGYTTTDQYPYSENASSQLVPGDTGLPSSYNYVRNSVKITVDAYTGQVTLYAIDPSDPILQAWESAFPGLFTKQLRMPPALPAHLKYPADIFSIQAAIFGRYHQTNPTSFYSNGDGWNLSPTDGAGPPSSTIQVSQQLSKTGAVLSQTITRMDPLYQVYALPGSKSPQYTLTDAFVASQSASQSSSSTSTPSSGVLNLTGFMVALSDPHDYGHLNVYRAPSGASTPGPVLADADMSSFPPASTKISYLDQHGSSVLLGNVLMVPINGSMLYMRPMYVTSSNTSYPQLKYFITVYKSNRGFASTLSSALTQVLGTNVPSTSHTGHLTATQLLARATADFKKATTALQDNHLGLYQQYINQGIAYVNEAYARSPGNGQSTSSSPTTTTTTPAKRKT